MSKHHSSIPSFRVSLIPVVWLLSCILVCIFTMGADSVLDMGKYVMLSAAVIAIIIARVRYKRRWRYIWYGVVKSARQLFPAMVVLLFIAMVSTMWMLSGVVPTLIDLGLQLLNPRFFLFTTCVICSVVSIFTGSSWTTIATIGVALQGIGTVFGYADGWIAGAIISGAYFGDKVSPLSDTTVLASSSCGVPLIEHVRYMLYSTIPAIVIALTVYLVAGLVIDTSDVNQSGDMLMALHSTFHVTPLTLVIPLVTFVLIVCRVNTNLTLACSSLMGVVGFVVWQPELLSAITSDVSTGSGIGATVFTLLRTLGVGAEIHSGNALLDELATTGGIRGMWSTFSLILCAMVFGGVLMSTGMLSAITRAFHSPPHQCAPNGDSHCWHRPLPQCHHWRPVSVNHPRRQHLQEALHPPSSGAAAAQPHGGGLHLRHLGAYSVELLRHDAEHCARSGHPHLSSLLRVQYPQSLHVAPPCLHRHQHTAGEEEMTGESGKQKKQGETPPASGHFSSDAVSNNLIQQNA